MVIRKYKFALANRELLKDYCARVLDAVKGVDFGELTDAEFDLDVVNSLMRANRGDIALPNPKKLVIDPIKNVLERAMTSYVLATNCLEEQYQKSHYYVAPYEKEKEQQVS